MNEMNGRVSKMLSGAESHGRIEQSKGIGVLEVGRGTVRGWPVVAPEKAAGAWAGPDVTLQSVACQLPLAVVTNSPTCLPSAMGSEA